MSCIYTFYIYFKIILQSKIHQGLGTKRYFELFPMLKSFIFTLRSVSDSVPAPWNPTGLALFPIFFSSGGGFVSFRLQMEGFTAEDLSTIGGIATVSLLHSFIPTHWLPFSVVGRVQKWTLSRTLLVSMFSAIDRTS